MIHQKIYWKIINHLVVLLSKLRKRELSTGLLPHRKKKKDYIYLGSFLSQKSTPKHTSLVLSNDWRFDQKYLNICTFASNTMASSYQEGKRFSVRWLVALGKRDGMITGNGFSYIRAPLDLSIKYGRLPYEMLPDEVNCSWEDYCNVKITDEMLQEAAKWKLPAYRKVTSESDAVELMDQGYCLVTGLKWYSSMNSPQPSNYYLNFTGGYIGGHAIDVDGYRSDSSGMKDYNNTNTFGSDYGDNGRARLKYIFGSGMFEVYMMEKIPGRDSVDRIADIYEGKCIKGDGPAIYKVINGQKCGFANWEAFTRENSSFINVTESVLNLLPDGEIIK